MAGEERYGGGRIVVCDFDRVDDRAVAGDALWIEGNWRGGAR